MSNLNLKFENKKWLNQYADGKVMEMIKVMEILVKYSVKGFLESLILNPDSKIENSKWIN